MSRKLVVGIILVTGLLVAAVADHRPKLRGAVVTPESECPFVFTSRPRSESTSVAGTAGIGSGMYYPWGWGWGGWPGYFPPYPYPGYYGYASASVRIQVEPKNAEVYVDGHLAGMVDDFDGFFQRLQVEPGGREITVYKDGFRSYTERLYVSAGQSYGIRAALEPLRTG